MLSGLVLFRTGKTIPLTAVTNPVILTLIIKRKTFLMSKGVTPQSKDYSAWYTDVVTKADLADYGPVKGTMVIKPFGFSLWKNIEKTGLLEPG